MKLKLMLITFVMFLNACSVDRPEANINIPEPAFNESPRDLEVEPEYTPVQEEELVENTEEDNAPELPEQYRPIVRAAGEGPELVGIELYGEKWNIKKALITTTEDSVFIEGRISHHIPFAPGDQIDYQFEFVDGMLQTTDVNIQVGGWAPIAGPILNIVAGLTQTPIPVGLITQVIADVEKLVKGDDWQMQSQKMAMIISLQLYADHMNSQEVEEQED